MDTNTISITDYEMKTPTIAKVVISFTGQFNKEKVRASLLKMLDNRAAPVDNSFRQIKAGVAVGFLRANREVRVVDPKELRASYRVMGSSNIMMSEVDNSLWEVKTGKGGTFLARHGQEDLSDLVESSTQRRSDIPRIAQLSMARAVPGEFVAFTSKSGDMDYGFAVAANAEKVQVVSSTTSMAAVATYEMVSFIGRPPIPKSFAQEMQKAGISREDKTQAIEYWKKLYAYNPEYLRMVIDQVNEGTIA
jgi:hypothetical protein